MIDIDFRDEPPLSEEEMLERWKAWNAKLGEQLRAEQAERDRQDEHDLRLWNERRKQRNMDGPQPHPLV
jgi:hypothetical protein